MIFNKIGLSFLYELEFIVFFIFQRDGKGDNIVVVSKDILIQFIKI